MHKIIISAVKRVEFVRDRISYIILRGHWCDIVLNVCPVTEDKTDDFCEELERVFDKFLKYYTKMFLGDFNVKVGRYSQSRWEQMFTRN
jgi:hypothetical protein